MGRVTGQEDVPRTVAAGDSLGGVPGGPAGDLYVEIGDADRAADVVDAPLVGELLQRFAAFGVPGRVEDPVLPVVHGQQGAVGRRVGQVADDEPALAHDVGEGAGAEGDADVAEQLTGTALADAELLADGAAGAVRGDEVVREDGGVLAGLPALEDRGDAGGPGVERQQFGGVPQIAAEPRGVVEEHRLQVVLAAQAP